MITKANFDDFMRQASLLGVHYQDERLDARLLYAVNSYINHNVAYVPDKGDYWQTLAETKELSAGDCEDKSIAKYFILLELGYPEDNLFFWYCKAKKLNNEAHMVLEAKYRANDTVVILDNLTPFVYRQELRDDLEFLYKFNQKELWSGGKQVGQGSDLSKMADLMSRVRARCGQKTT